MKPSYLIHATEIIRGMFDSLELVALKRNCDGEIPIDFALLITFASAIGTLTVVVGSPFGRPLPCRFPPRRDFAMPEECLCG